MKISRSLRALTQIGKEGTEEEFNKALGRNLVVPAGTTKSWGGHGFKQARNAFFAGEGIGRRFLADILPGKLRAATVSEVLTSFYGKKREEAKKKDADEKKEGTGEAKEKKAKAQAEKDAKEADRLVREAEAEQAEAEKAREEAERQGTRHRAKLADSLSPSLLRG